MMTQADLLELAKQGNAQAIASLMNLTLQPKGVTAKTAFQDGCLHVFFYSKQLLSQSAIVQFVQHGLAALGTSSIQQVKIYAQNDAEQPVWTDAFRLNFANSPQPANYPSVPHPPAVPQPRPNPTQPAFVHSSPAVAGSISGSVSGSIPASLGTVSDGYLRLPDFSQPGAPSLRPRSAKSAARSQPARLSANRSGLPAGSAPWQYAIARQSRRLKSLTQHLIVKASSSNKYVIAGAIAVSAFLCGGIIALVTSSQAHTSSDQPASTVASNQLAFGTQTNRSPGEQQADAKLYLLQMNKAQQLFYQTNNRFASSLEELERSAAIMAQSTSYSYQLSLPDPTHSQLIAIPKGDGLKSYTSLVSQNSSAQSAATPANLICETNQPSKTPPTLAIATDGKAQCPDATTAIAN